MPNNTMLFMKAVASSFYGRMMRKNSYVPQESEKEPITIAEQQCFERVRKVTSHHADELVDVMRYLSAEEQEFLQRLKDSFQLNEDDLHLFHLVGYARHANVNEIRCNPELKWSELAQPEFSPKCLSLLMEWVQPTLASSRGYFAAMVHLKHHPVPEAWRPEDTLIKTPLL